jgi:hypothetical protein
VLKVPGLQGEPVLAFAVSEAHDELLGVGLNGVFAA